MKNKDIIRFIEARVEEHQKNLASYEKIKRFTLLPEPFMMVAELTDSAKVATSGRIAEVRYRDRGDVRGITSLSAINYFLLRGKFKKEKNI